jgi:hypothetical protein
MIIDVNFDFRADSNGGDPDAKSSTLRKYHRILWSKKLPNGKYLKLDEKLHNETDACDYIFGSDSIIHSFSMWSKYQHIIKQIDPEEIEELRGLGYTIGGMLIFPKNRINNCHSINMARGCNRKIMDRFDLTLECIKRFYERKESPLTKSFNNYSDFLEMFVDFKNYVNFFHLQDLVTEDYTKINFHHPFVSFECNLLPETTKEYLEYKKKNIIFINNRNRRIEKWVKDNLV